MRFRFTVFLCLAAASVAAADEAALQEVSSLQQVLRNIDDNSNFENSDFSCTYTFVSEEPGAERSVRQAKLFRRDRNDSMVIVILKPEVQRGQGYLQTGENMWFYDPESRKFTHTSVKDSFQETVARNGDFRRSAVSEDYRIESSADGTLGDYDVIIADLEAVSSDVPYPFLKLWIRKDNHIILKSEEFSLTRRLIRTGLFPKYAKVDDKYVPTLMLFVDALIEGKKTQITLKEISLKELSDSVFTKSYIERVNR